MASLLWLTDHARNRAVPVSNVPPATSQSITARPEPASYSNAGLTVRFIDVGQADAALITTENHAMLIDGGNVGDADIIYTVVAREATNGLDYVIGTHGHEDHIGGLPAAYRAAKVRNTLCSVTDYNSKAFRNFAKAANDASAEIQVPETNKIYDLGDGAAFEILAVNAFPENTNNTSIVLVLTYGETRFLFTGDTETPVEKAILETKNDIGAQVLKLGHHGSSTSTSYEFLKAANPTHAVISCGTDNKYGHPHDETMSRLRDAGVRVWRTDIQGDIIMTSDGENISVTVDRNDLVQTNLAYAQSTPNTPPDPTTSIIYIGNKKSKKVHRPDCAYTPAKTNQIALSSLNDATEAGYELCGACLGS